MRLSRLLPVVAAGIVLAGCGADGNTGACKGLEDGTYYQLEVNNYLTERQEIRVNGRFVGSVPAGQLKNDPVNTGAIKPGYARLGEFPICDKTSIDFRSKAASFSQFVCTNAKITSDACRIAKDDYCFISFQPVPAGQMGLPPGSDSPAISSPLCDSKPECQGSITIQNDKCP